MRLKTAALCTASLAALAFATPAAAQEAPVDAAAEAQTNPADPDPAADAPADDAIVVTGLRRSLRSAQNIKRNSDQIVDAIVAEDIGKLPDTTVSDTAARIPGIQVERNGGEASRVLVRGLDRFYYATTYNGREIFTAETRSVSLADFPAGAVAAVEAFKTSTADLVEPGISGLVNVRSRRPFDFKDREIAGSAWVLYPNQSREKSLNGNLLIADRWSAGDNEFGGLIGVSYTQLKFKDSTRRHGFFIADLAGGRSPDWPEIQYNIGNRWRPSVNGALQFRSGDLQLYGEALWQGYRERESDSQWAQPLWNCGEATYSNIQFAPNSRYIVSGRVNQPGCDGNGNGGFPFGFAAAGTRKTNTYQIAFGGSYDAGPLKITADVARTDSRFDLEVESVDWQLRTNNFTVDWFTGLPGGNGPTLTISGIDLANINNYSYRGLFEEYLTAEGDDWQGRLDFDYETGVSFLPRLQVGVRAVDRVAARSGGAVYWDLFGSGIPLSATGLQWELLQPGFRGDDNRPTPSSWFAPTFDSVQNNLVAFRQFNIGLRGAGAINGGTVRGPNRDPLRSFDISENSLAGYAQLSYAFDLGGIAIDGKLGLRGVQTKVSLSGFSTLTGTPAPIDFDNKYTDWLPNLNLRAALANGLVMRFAATQTRTRPEFGDLNPSLNFGAPVVCPPNATNCFRNASGGNPFLKPLESNNLDASLEYYFSRGFAALNVFHRKMTGFILGSSYILPDRDPNGVQVQVGGPINSADGRISGIEAQVRTFFDIPGLPSFLRNFGVEANVTRLNAKTDQPTPIGVQRLRIPDTSKWVANLTGMYEGGGFTSRLSYNWRSKYPEGAISDRGNFTLQGRGRGGSRLDFSNSYDLNNALTVFVDWSNILKKPFQSDIVRINNAGGRETSREVFPLVTRFEESIVSAGLRFRI